MTLTRDDVVKKVKLSHEQERALLLLVEIKTQHASAYNLQVSLGTLEALRKKGLVDKHYKVGALLCPRTGISWTITPVGRRWLQHNHLFSVRVQ